MRFISDNVTEHKYDEHGNGNTVKLKNIGHGIRYIYIYIYIYIIFLNFQLTHCQLTYK